MQAEWFKDWFNSPYYHQLYFERDESEAALFIDKVIDHLAPDIGSKMLDVACGKGRHSMQLAVKGFDVTGIDLSENSIHEASQENLDNLHFYRHDMRLLFWINYFDYVFNLFTSFGYFNTTRENNDAVHTMALAMKKGGILVLDYLNAHYAVAHSVPEEEKTINGTLFKIKKWNDEQFFHKRIEIIGSDMRNPLIFTERVSKFYLQDFERMFAANGLKIKNVFGDYGMGVYNQDASPRMVIIAEKG